MKFQPHVTFSAQAVVFRSLMTMLAKVGDEEKGGDPFEYLPVAIFMAFSVEAYINSVGARKILAWEHLERLPWRSKVEILHQNANAKADWGAEPLQFAQQIFSIRDRIAHGKPETVSGPVCDDSQSAVSILMVQNLKPSAIKGLTREWVLSSGEKLYLLLEYLGSLFRLRSDDFTSFSTSKVERYE